MAIIYLIPTSNVDETFINEIQQYESAHRELKKEIQYLDALDKPNYRSSQGMVVDFTINESNIPENLPKLKALFKQQLVKDVIITPKGEILFNLKLCASEDCKNNSAGFSGPYNHYLAIGDVNFINEKWVKIIEEKAFGNWTYFIVWTQKG